ncbi:MAG: ABC transporter permease subunit [Clostridia bacterium]
MTNLQAIDRVGHRRLFIGRLRRYRFIYLMLLPVALYFIVFSYYPMALGIVNSFQEIKLLGNSSFVGLKNYQKIFVSPVYTQAFYNTLIMGAGTFVLQTAWGLLLALYLNEIRSKPVKSAFQTISYIPYLLSWSVVGSMWITILSPTGLMNGILAAFGGENFRKIVFMSEQKYAQGIMIFTGAWKGAGYCAALFLAAIVSIDPTLYEAASIDGASRLQQTAAITVPSIASTIKVVVVLGVMGLLRNFDQIYIMSNASILDKVRNLLYLIYTDGIVQFKIGIASAAACVVLVATMLITFVVRKAIHYDEIE